MLSRREFVEEMKFSSGVKTLTDLLTSMSSTFSKQDEQGDSPAFRHFIIKYYFGVLSIGPIESHKMFPLIVTKLKVKVKVAPSCPTLCNPMDYSVLGIL